MRIAVCIKQVPARENCRMDPENGVLLREGGMRMNPYDMFALETALRLAGEEGSVTAFTMGPLSAEAVLKEAFSMGAARGVLISDRAFAGADVLATSYTLSEAIRSYGPFDAIVCGRQTTDGDTGQVGPAVAAHLGMEYLGWVKKAEVLDEKTIYVEQIRNDCIYSIKAAFPFVMSVEQDIFKPRIPTLKMKLQSGKMKIEHMAINNMKDTCLEHYGLKGSPTRVVRIFEPEPKEKGDVKKVDGKTGALMIETIITDNLKRGK